MSMIWTFDDTENKYDIYRRRDCILGVISKLETIAIILVNTDST